MLGRRSMIGLLSIVVAFLVALHVQWSPASFGLYHDDSLYLKLGAGARDGRGLCDSQYSRGAGSDQVSDLLSLVVVFALESLADISRQSLRGLLVVCSGRMRLSSGLVHFTQTAGRRRKNGFGVDGCRGVPSLDAVVEHIGSSGCWQPFLSRRR